MIKSVQCAFCIHCKRGEDNYYCAAFPEGIPEDILEGRHDHRLPYPGDHGIRLTLKPGLSPAILGELPLVASLS